MEIAEKGNYPYLFPDQIFEKRIPRPSLFFSRLGALALPLRGGHHHGAGDVAGDVDGGAGHVQDAVDAQHHAHGQALGGKTHGGEDHGQHDGPRAGDPGVSDLGGQLAIRDVATVNSIKFSLRQTGDGEYFLSIDRDTAVMGGYIDDARSRIYDAGPFASRSEAERGRGAGRPA